MAPCRLAALRTAGAAPPYRGVVREHDEDDGQVSNMSSDIGPWPWRILLVLWIAAVAVTPLIWPYADRLIAIAPHAPSLPDDVATRLLIRNLVLATILIPVGLFCARRLGLATPYLDSWLYGRGRPEPVARLFTRSVVWALAVSAGIFAIDLLFSALLGVTHPAPEIHARIPGVEAWRGIPLSFYASITEELGYRLFLMSTLAWVAISVTRAHSGTGAAIVFWAANLVAAIVFGWSHVAGVELFGPASDLVLLRTYLILLIPGLVFGQLYRTRGLETAIACHFFVDIVVHVMRPLVDPGA
jgi:membrane protease YdiL (CAAX protease family)